MKTKSAIEILALCFAVSIFCFTIGFVSGSSLNPITYVLIPALLSIFGSIVSFIVTKQERKNYLFVSIIIIIFTFNTAYGLYHGTIHRDQYLKANDIELRDVLIK